MTHRFRLNPAYIFRHQIAWLLFFACVCVCKKQHLGICADMFKTLWEFASYFRSFNWPLYLSISNLRTFHLCPVHLSFTEHSDRTPLKQSKVLHTVRCNQCENKISPQIVIRFVFGLNKRRSFALKQYLLCVCFFISLLIWSLFRRVVFSVHFE